MGESDEAPLEVVTGAVRAEAGRWDQVSAEMYTIARDLGNLWLNETAFWVGATLPGELAEQYRRMHLLMYTTVNGGVTETGQLGDALRRVAQLYDDTDSTDHFNLTEQFTAPPPPRNKVPNAF